jgi:hypothetical protein
MPVHAMLENGTEEIQRYQFSISALDAETKLHAPAALLLAKKALCIIPLVGWVAQGRSGRFGEETRLPLPGMEPRILDL